MLFLLNVAGALSSVNDLQPPGMIRRLIVARHTDVRAVLGIYYVLLDITWKIPSTFQCMLNKRIGLRISAAHESPRGGGPCGKIHSTRRNRDVYRTKRCVGQLDVVYM